MTTTDATVDAFFAAVRSIAERAGVFGAIEVREGVLRCAARNAAADAWYRLRRDEGPGRSGGIPGPWIVELVTPDRWLSESIEADLMHHGDPIEELVHDEMVELIELGGAPNPPVVRHFRSDDMLYTFQTALDGVAPGADHAATLLLAYEAAFRPLGDMEAGEDE